MSRSSGVVLACFSSFVQTKFNLGEADIKIVDKIGNCRFNMVLKYYFDSFADVDENGEKKVK